MMITILSRCDYYDSNETSREDEDAFSKEAEHVKIPQQKNKVIFNPQTKLNACFGPHEWEKHAIINCDGAQDAVNNFLKTASKLTSIEENSELSSGKKWCHVLNIWYCGHNSSSSQHINLC